MAERSAVKCTNTASGRQVRPHILLRWPKKPTQAVNPACGDICGLSGKCLLILAAPFIIQHAESVGSAPYSRVKAVFSWGNTPHVDVDTYFQSAKSLPIIHFHHLK